LGNRVSQGRLNNAKLCANLAQVYVQQQQQWVSASQALEQAVAIGGQTFGTDHPKTRTFVEGLDWVNSQLT
jgi:hypothetical protein